MSRALSAIIVMLFCLPNSVVQAERVHKIRRNIQGHKEQIGEVQEEIERSEAQIKAMRQKERLILDRLDQMELQLQRTHKRLTNSRRERDSLRQEISEKNKKLEQLNQELKELRPLLSQRLETLYKFGQQGYVSLLTSAKDLSSFQHLWMYLRTIAEQDSDLINQVQNRQIEEKELTLALASREKRLSKLVHEIGQQKKEMEKVKLQQVVLLQDIHNREEMYQRYIAELATVSRTLQNDIDELQRDIGRDRSETRELKGGFASKRGALPYPVQGKVVSRFGMKRHKKFGTKIRNNGVDIATGQLSPVVAVYGGQVLYSARVKGYGEVIIIDHGDKYYTLTGHLSETFTEVGEPVKAGEVIGYAGYSPVEGEGGRVYFEVRHLGKALDPDGWLLPALASVSDPGAQ
jgi:septal ring factor EnvC (AmiA/AmiB activator)